QKRQYAKQAREAAKQGASAAEKTAVSAEKLAEKVAGFVKRHPGGVVITLACLLLLFTVQSCASSLVTLGNGIIGGIGASTYPAQDGDMLGAEAAYCALEAELQHYLDTYTSTHDYDEYHFDLDDIEHDPYVLISMLSALHEGEWTLEEVRGTIQTIFDRQYILAENVVVEVRYRTETRTGPDGPYTVRVPYNYYICTVTLKNEDLSHLPIYIMGGEQLSRYALYMAALGNRPDLFPNSGYVDKYITNPPQPYDVPEQYLSDPDFAALLTEAEKYLGYPYVWGGSSPATSFDCSGFLSYVLNQCGWDVGRLGAQGLYNYCTPVSSPRPGDLVFFRYTYDAPNPDGVTHCGLYVGDGMMLHCGDPVQFTSLNTSYWQSHFYAWGRLP
ncbi:C40 family peptidase, partial [uncultured Oscillibacter sp.]|uniref:C40 family peptidase n=1 Tax=uncultured Oscillibacter sp. TaxID=876091 RepID=UPI00266E95E1